MRPSFIAAAKSDRARSDAQPRSTCCRNREAAIFDLRRREFIPLLGAAGGYPSPANMRERIGAAVRPRRVCTTCGLLRLLLPRLERVGKGALAGRAFFQGENGAAGCFVKRRGS